MSVCKNYLSEGINKEIFNVKPDSFDEFMTKHFKKAINDPYYCKETIYQVFDVMPLSFFEMDSTLLGRILILMSEEKINRFINEWNNYNIHPLNEIADKRIAKIIQNGYSDKLKIKFHDD